MKRKNRIRKNKDFKRIINTHKCIKTDEFIIFQVVNSLSLTRVGISVSSKLGNAVVRNKIKRQIKSMVNKLLNLTKGIDIVIIVREGFKKNTYEQNITALKKLINHEKENA